MLIRVVEVVMEKSGVKGLQLEKEDVSHPKTMPLRGW